MNKPNYRIYDRTGGGVTEDIFAENLTQAIEMGQSWIEDGDWTTEPEDDKTSCKTIELKCEVGPIIYVDVKDGIYTRPDGTVFQKDETDRFYNDREGYLTDNYDIPLEDGDIDEDATYQSEKHDCSGEYTDEEPECPHEDGWDWVSVTEMGKDFSSYSNGGTAYTHYYVCRNTGWYKSTFDPGCQRNCDKPVLEEVYSEPDEESLEWIGEFQEI